MSLESKILSLTDLIPEEEISWTENVTEKPEEESALREMAFDLQRIQKKEARQLKGNEETMLLYTEALYKDLLFLALGLFPDDFMRAGNDVVASDRLQVQTPTFEICPAGKIKKNPQVPVTWVEKV